MTELSNATLGGYLATHARADIPAWGAWYAEASIDGEHTLAGAVELRIADLVLKGAVLSGGPDAGRSHYRIVAGAGGWGKTIDRKSYVNDLGVSVATVVRDAAEAVGETVELDTTDRLGPAFVRPEGPAARVLELVAPGAWYIGEDGVTRLGARPVAPLTTPNVTHGPLDLARGTVTLAAESIARILPGCVVDGLTAVDVMHSVSAASGLRSTVWGSLAGKSSRRLDSLRALAEGLDPLRRFRGVTEYRVVTLEGDLLNLQAVQVSTGMPDLARVVGRPGVPGMKGAAALASRVLVGFVNSDPSRPYVAAYEDAGGVGFAPTSLSMITQGMVASGHVATVEATALMIYNIIAAALPAAVSGITPAKSTTTSSQLGTALADPSFATALLAAIPGALQGQAAPAPAPPILNTAPLCNAAIAAGLAAKIPDPTGLVPNLGAKAVMVG